MDTTKKYINAISWKQYGLIYLPAQPTIQDTTPFEKSMIGKTLCYSDVAGFVVPLEEVVAMIRDIPRLVLVRYASSLSAVFDRENFSNKEVQLAITKTLACGKYKSKIIDLVQKDNRCMFAPRTLAALLKMGIAFGKEEIDEDSTLPEKIITAQLALTDHLDRDFEEQVRRESQELEPTLEVRQAIMRFAVQNSDIIAHQDPVEISCRMWAVLHLHPKKLLAEQGRGLTPSEIFFDATGIDLAHFMAVIYAPTIRLALIDFNDHSSIDDNLIINKNVFTGTAVDPDLALKHFKKMTLPQKTITKLRKTNPNDPNYFFDFSAFKEFPLYEVGLDNYLPMYYPFFRWRVTEGLYWDIATAAKDDHIKETFMNNFGYYFESYMQNSFEKVFPSEGPFRRMWSEPKEKDSDPAPDIIVQYPGAYLFVEVKAARLKYYESILKGQWQDIEDDCRKMLFEPAEQLDKAIKFFCEGKLQLDGRKWEGERIYPVIITYGMAPVFQAPWLYIKEELRHRGFLQQQHINDVVTLNSYEALSLLNLAVNGHSIVDMLRDKTSPQYDLVNFQNYAISVYGKEATPRKIIDDYWEDFTTFMRQAIIPK